MQYILYLHGFHSSPYSEKTQLFKRHIKQHHSNVEVVAPQLPPKPELALSMLRQLTEEYDFSGVIGSSLGGYLATYLHNEFGLPIVVINPAVRPFELLHEYLGPQVHPITNEEYDLVEGDMHILKDIYQANVLDKSKVWLLQQEKDEVLDYRQALDMYQGCKISFELGGNHSFVGFDRYLPEIVTFFELD